MLTQFTQDAHLSSLMLSRQHLYKLLIHKQPKHASHQLKTQTLIKYKYSKLETHTETKNIKQLHYIHVGLLWYTEKHRERYSKISRNFSSEIFNELFSEIFSITKIDENVMKTCIYPHH